MELASLVLTVISTLASVVSAIAAISVKAEVKEFKNKITGKSNVQNSGKISVNNKGNNEGIILGVNTGDIRK